MIELLGRDTHKIAFSDHRIQAVNHEAVSFLVKAYRKGAQTTCLTLSKKALIRRYTLQILPKAFVSIKHYGILSTAGKKKYLKIIRDQTGKLATIAQFGVRGPPKQLMRQISRQNKERHRA